MVKTKPSSNSDKQVLDGGTSDEGYIADSEGRDWVYSATQGTVSDATWIYNWRQMRARWHPDYLFGARNNFTVHRHWDEDYINSDYIIAVDADRELASYGYPYPIYNQSVTVTEKSDSLRRRSRGVCPWFCIILIFILGVLITVPVIVAMILSSSNPASPSDILGKVRSELILARFTYTDEMSNASSPVFKRLAAAFEKEMRILYQSNITKNQYAGSKISKVVFLGNDSMKVEYDLFFRVKHMRIPTHKTLQTILYSVDRDVADQSLGMLGDLRFRIDSNKIIESKVVRRDVMNSILANRTIIIEVYKDGEILNGTNKQMNEDENSKNKSSSVIITRKIIIKTVMPGTIEINRMKKNGTENNILDSTEEQTTAEAPNRINEFVTLPNETISTATADMMKVLTNDSKENSKLSNRFSFENETSENDSTEGDFHMIDILMNNTTELSQENEEESIIETSEDRLTTTSNPNETYTAQTVDPPTTSKTSAFETSFKTTTYIPLETITTTQLDMTSEWITQRTKPFSTEPTSNTEKTAKVLDSTAKLPQMKKVELSTVVIEHPMDANNNSIIENQRLATTNTTSLTDMQLQATKDESHILDSKESKQTISLYTQEIKNITSTFSQTTRNKEQDIHQEIIPRQEKNETRQKAATHHNNQTHHPLFSTLREKTETIQLKTNLQNTGHKQTTDALQTTTSEPMYISIQSRNTVDEQQTSSSQFTFQSQEQTTTHDSSKPFSQYTAILSKTTTEDQPTKSSSHLTTENQERPTTTIAVPMIITFFEKLSETLNNKTSNEQTTTGTIDVSISIRSTHPISRGTEQTYHISTPLRTVKEQTTKTPLFFMTKSLKPAIHSLLNVTSSLENIPTSSTFGNHPTAEYLGLKTDSQETIKTPAVPLMTTQTEDSSIISSAATTISARFRTESIDSTMTPSLQKIFSTNEFLPSEPRATTEDQPIKNSLVLTYKPKKQTTTTSSETTTTENIFKSTKARSNMNDQPTTIFSKLTTVIQDPTKTKLPQTMTKPSHHISTKSGSPFDDQLPLKTIQIVSEPLQTSTISALPKTTTTTEYLARVADSALDRQTTRTSLQSSTESTPPQLSTTTTKTEYLSRASRTTTNGKPTIPFSKIETKSMEQMKVPLSSTSTVSTKIIFPSLRSSTDGQSTQAHLRFTIESPDAITSDSKRLMTSTEYLATVSNTTTDNKPTTSSAQTTTESKLPTTTTVSSTMKGPTEYTSTLLRPFTGDLYTSTSSQMTTATRGSKTTTKTITNSSKQASTFTHTTTDFESTATEINFPTTIPVLSDINRKNEYAISSMTFMQLRNQSQAQATKVILPLSTTLKENESTASPKTISRELTTSPHFSKESVTTKNTSTPSRTTQRDRSTMKINPPDPPTRSTIQTTIATSEYMSIQYPSTIGDQLAEGSPPKTTYLRGTMTSPAITTSSEYTLHPHILTLGAQFAKESSKNTTFSKEPITTPSFTTSTEYLTIPYRSTVGDQIAKESQQNTTYSRKPITSPTITTSIEYTTIPYLTYVDDQFISKLTTEIQEMIPTPTLTMSPRENEYLSSRITEQTTTIAIPTITTPTSPHHISVGDKSTQFSIYSEGTTYTPSVPTITTSAENVSSTYRKSSDDQSAPLSQIKNETKEQTTIIDLQTPAATTDYISPAYSYSINDQSTTQLSQITTVTQEPTTALPTVNVSTEYIFTSSPSTKYERLTAETPSTLTIIRSTGFTPTASLATADQQAKGSFPNLSSEFLDQTTLKNVPDFTPSHMYNFTASRKTAEQQTTNTTSESKSLTTIVPELNTATEYLSTNSRFTVGEQPIESLRFPTVDLQTTTPESPTLTIPMKFTSTAASSITVDQMATTSSKNVTESKETTPLTPPTTTVTEYLTELSRTTTNEQPITSSQMFTEIHVRPTTKPFIQELSQTSTTLPTMKNSVVSIASAGQSSTNNTVPVQSTKRTTTFLTSFSGGIGILFPPETIPIISAGASALIPQNQNNLSPSVTTDTTNGVRNEFFPFERSPGAGLLTPSVDRPQGSISNDISVGKSNISGTAETTTVFNPAFEYLWSLGDSVLETLLSREKVFKTPDRAWDIEHIASMNGSEIPKQMNKSGSQFVAISQNDIKSKETDVSANIGKTGIEIGIPVVDDLRTQGIRNQSLLKTKTVTVMPQTDEAQRVPASGEGIPLSLENPELFALLDNLPPLDIYSTNQPIKSDPVTSSTVDSKITKSVIPTLLDLQLDPLSASTIETPTKTSFSNPTSIENPFRNEPSRESAFDMRSNNLLGFGGLGNMFGGGMFGILSNSDFLLREPIRKNKNSIDKSSSVNNTDKSMQNNQQSDNTNLTNNSPNKNLSLDSNSSKPLTFNPIINEFISFEQTSNSSSSKMHRNSSVIINKANTQLTNLNTSAKNQISRNLDISTSDNILTSNEIQPTRSRELEVVNNNFDGSINLINDGNFGFFGNFLNMDTNDIVQPSLTVPDIGSIDNTISANDGDLLSNELQPGAIDFTLPATNSGNGTLGVVPVLSEFSSDSRNGMNFLPDANPLDVSGSLAAFDISNALVEKETITVPSIPVKDLNDTINQVSFTLNSTTLQDQNVENDSSNVVFTRERPGLFSISSSDKLTNTSDIEILDSGLENQLGEDVTTQLSGNESGDNVTDNQTTIVTDGVTTLTVDFSSLQNNTLEAVTQASIRNSTISTIKNVTSAPEVLFELTQKAYIGYPVTLVWRLFFIDGWKFIIVQKEIPDASPAIIGVVTEQSMIAAPGFSSLSISTDSAFTPSEALIYVDIPSVVCEDGGMYTVRVLGTSNSVLADRSDFLNLFDIPVVQTVVADNLFENSTFVDPYCVASLGYPQGRLFLQVRYPGDESYSSFMSTPDVENVTLTSDCRKVVRVSFGEYLNKSMDLNLTDLRCGVVDTPAILNEDGIIFSNTETINIIPDTVCNNSTSLRTHPFRPCNYIDCAKQEVIDCPQNTCFNSTSNICDTVNL